MTNRRIKVALGGIVHPLAIIAAVAGLSWVVGSGRSGTDDPEAMGSAAKYLPTRDEGSGISFQGAKIPGVENVLSIGETVTGIVATVETESGREVRLYTRSGEAAREFDEVDLAFRNVEGIALSDPHGNIAVWVERVESEAGVSETAVIVDATTGRILDRHAVDDHTMVTAVNNRTVALSGASRGELWSVGKTPEQLPYVPDDYGVVGLSPSRIAVADIDAETRIYGRDGKLLTKVAELASWSVDSEVERLVGASRNGDIIDVDMRSGKVTSLDAPLHAYSARVTDDGAIVARSLKAVIGQASGGEQASGSDVAICRSGECTTTQTAPVPYLPNSALGQIASQSY